MRKENKYAIAFDANKDFREIRIGNLFDKGNGKGNGKQ